MINQHEIHHVRIGEAYRKLCDGEEMTDSELLDLHVHVRVLSKLLLSMGDKFRLQHRETIDVMHRTKGFLDARRERGIEKRNHYVPEIPDEKYDPYA
jgi:hypothetical protein